MRMGVTMREISRVQKRRMYLASGIGSKNSFKKLPVILCTAVGILLGTFTFQAANKGIKSMQAGELNKDINQYHSTQVIVNSLNDALFKLFDMDRYNPITIVNKNYPYFKMFYDNQYMEYLAQKEQQELAQKENEQKKLQDQKVKAQAETASQSSPNIAGFLKEVSSSITFEGDVEQSEIKNNPVVSNGKIKIINQTKYSIDIEKLLKEPLKFKFNNSGPQLLIYHTHTTESFLKSIDQLKMSGIPSRTTDSRYNVVRVGNALISNLKKYKINVLHDTIIHDKDYNNSYPNSLKTLSDYLDKYSSLKMTIDLHRDAAGEQKLRVAKTLNGSSMAQIMFVIGTDSRQSNPKWRENLKLAVKIQARLNQICPGLAKPIYLSQKRYNQHLTGGSVIIEIGGDGNVIDECVRSTSYLAQAINDVVK
jgi:stage II sporulation protein P